MDEESDDPPFRTEYAKSNRATCKHCKLSISKDSLRLARMVQSHAFDGKVPFWYHYSCFFRVAKVTSMSQVGGVGGLRWDDQQKLRSVIEKGKPSSNGVAGGKEMVDGPLSGQPTTIFTVEVASSGRSTCRKCREKIEKGTPRIYYMHQAEGSERWNMDVPYHHHVNCFVDSLADLDAVGLDVRKIAGFGDLDSEMRKELVTAFPKAMAGKKRKGQAKQEVPEKRAKEDPQEKILRLQNEKLWRIRDRLQACLTQAELKSMLELNNQDIPSGESRLLDRCADGVLFGALRPCSTCHGQLVARTHQYICSGHISGWTMCQVKTTEAERTEWLIPDDLEQCDFLSKYKKRKEVRLFPPMVESVDGPSSSAPSSSQPPAGNDKPLHGFNIAIAGRLGSTKAELTEQITGLGGTVVSSVSKKTTVCISNPAELDSGSRKMLDAESKNVPVVDESFLSDAAKGEALSKIPTHIISSWGATKDSLSVQRKSETKKSLKKEESKVKMQLKHGSVVDPDSGLADTYHVLEYPRKTLYNAVLGMVDVMKGTNSYYKLQLLESDRGGVYQLFRAWGRVGTTIGGNKLEYFHSDREDAMEAFERLYAEKTGIVWINRHNSAKVPGKFYPLEIDYGNDEDSTTSLPSTTKSTLAPEIQDLVRMIFNVESMKKVMMEFEIDMKKMPLGKLSRRQMQSAYTVLTTLLSEIKGSRDPTRILDWSNQFYTLIPHDFGMQKPPLLDSEDVVASKTLMVDSLMEIELAYSMLKEKTSGDETKDPLDAHFEKLKTDMEVVAKGSDEFRMIAEYVANTHAATHAHYKLKVLEVFSVARRGESKRFKPFSKLHNRMLLWHGSRTTNFAGIFSKGLRIAPPEAPVTGYMFGKGVYFADMASKSANYCCTSSRDNVGLMLLCEVALGNMYEKTSAEFVTRLPAGKHSTKGIGQTMPNPQGNRTTDSGAVIPMGKSMSANVKKSSLLYNEYVVYDVAQIRMKYLLKLDFQYHR